MNFRRILLGIVVLCLFVYIVNNSTQAGTTGAHVVNGTTNTVWTFVTSLDMPGM